MLWHKQYYDIHLIADTLESTSKQKENRDKPYSQDPEINSFNLLIYIFLNCSVCVYTPVFALQKWSIYYIPGTVLSDYIYYII